MDNIFRIIKKNDTISFPFVSLKKKKTVRLSNSLIFPESLMLG